MKQILPQLPLNGGTQITNSKKTNEKFKGHKNYNEIQKSMLKDYYNLKAD